MLHVSQFPWALPDCNYVAKTSKCLVEYSTLHLASQCLLPGGSSSVYCVVQIELKSFWMSSWHESMWFLFFSSVEETLWSIKFRKIPSMLQAICCSNTIINWYNFADGILFLPCIWQQVQDYIWRILWTCAGDCSKFLIVLPLFYLQPSYLYFLLLWK